MRSYWGALVLCGLVACDDGSDGVGPDSGAADAAAVDGAARDGAAAADSAPDPDDGIPADAAADAGQTDGAMADGTTPDSAMTDGAMTDAGAMADGALSDGALPDAAQPDAGAVACGDERLPVDQIRGTEGITVAPDGTFYYSQSEAIGRRSPGGDPERRWVSLPGSNTVWGLAFRDEDGVLFAASPSNGGQVFRIDTRAAQPLAEVWHRGAGGPNGLIIGPDGLPYYTDFFGGHVFRIDAANMVTRISLRPIESANGLLFDDDGALLVLSYGAGEVFRLTLDERGREADRELVKTVQGAALDGIARDDEGRYYLGDNGNGRLLRYDADFNNEEVLLRQVQAAANVLFGRGALACTDVYVASGGTLGVYAD